MFVLSPIFPLCQNFNTLLVTEVSHTSRLSFTGNTKFVVKVMLLCVIPNWNKVTTGIISDI